MRLRRSSLTAIGLGAAIAVTAIAGSGGAANADTGTPDGSDDPAQQLAERFAPVVMIKEQAEECDDTGEPFVPMPVEIVLDNPQIALRQVSRGDPVVVRGPSAADLAGLGEGFYLDFPGSSLRPDCLYERDFLAYTDGVAPTIYAHIVQQPDEPDRVFVQYWFYWYYNDWNNKHESDWEGIILEFEASSIEAALQTTPVAVGYAQHNGGERAEWDDDKLGKDGDRPIVYSSAGSHASYFGSALYLGRSGTEGFGCDDTSGPSRRIDPEVVVLPDRVDDPTDSLAWLSYQGRWGERQQGAFDGPTGPAVKDRWLDPAAWFEDLRANSVVIPAGDSGAAAVIDVFCRTVERGSQAVITFTTSPERVLIGIGLLVLFIRWLVRRTDWSIVPPTPVVRRRRAGQIIRAAGREYRRSPAAYVLIGLVYVPAAVFTGILVALAEFIPFVASLLSLAGTASGTSLVLALLVGSIANVAAFIAVGGVTSAYLDRSERGIDAAITALRSGWDRRRDLFGAFIRSFLVVFVLLASFIGIPWGVRQLVRYQFVAQAVMFDDCDGAGALRRSSDVVRGRWWHTAVVAASLNGAVGLTALVVSLLLLVVASGLPLWLFSVLVSLVYPIVVPLASIAVTLLYGDAVAERSEQPEPVPVPVA